jgi:hypothetical protein
MSGSWVVPLAILILSVDWALIVAFKERRNSAISRNLFIIFKQQKNVDCFLYEEVNLKIVG